MPDKRQAIMFPNKWTAVEITIVKTIKLINIIRPAIIFADFALHLKQAILLGLKNVNDLIDY